MARRAAAVPAGESLSYTDLYARWEHGNWSATSIDFTVDRDHWSDAMDADQRRAALWNYAMFVHGEHAVAASLAPFIDAAPTLDQKYFLATQQVDEARHAVFFGRFLSEVAGAGAGIDAALLATDAELTWGFRRIFALLDEKTAELKQRPTPEKLAAAVTLYHLLIEASLAQPGQRFIERFLDESGLLPGFREGMQRVAQDEQRHIGFGVKLLADLVARAPSCREAVADLLREAIPYTLSVFVPPDWDESYVRCFGFSLEDIYADGTRSFESKLRAAGLPPEDLFGAVPMRFDFSPQQRAERMLLLLRANMLGEKNGPPSHDSEAVAALFDTVRLAVDHRHAPPRPVTIEWEFSDHAPWTLHVANGDTSVHEGRVDDPDLTFRCTLEDWVDVVAGREDAGRAIVRRRLRPRGDLRLLLRSRRLFGG